MSGTSWCRPGLCVKVVGEAVTKAFVFFRTRPVVLSFYADGLFVRVSLKGRRSFSVSVEGQVRDIGTASFVSEISFGAEGRPGNDSPNGRTKAKGVAPPFRKVTVTT